MPSRALVAALLFTLGALPAAGGLPARRVVSLNPSLTATLVALGAGAQLVGVDDYSARQQSAVRELPAVGGLFTPSLEAILGLAPDLVALVPSAQQRDLRARLEALGDTKAIAAKQFNVLEANARRIIANIAAARSS